eukprot:TRINITY_DN2522_c0_g1_i2.p1 TRINITY_DN2522_c0_g1~~TRINITY_DN2522_c0_g1_i2.p1  ORF type:complete len:140 (-),score=2.85 TRINITY_DN2522_c0_g1_i2:33-452(-)
MIALSMHSVFEGIALGVQNSESHILTLFIAVTVHKWAESVALVTAFIKSKRSRKFSLLFLILFACASPLGIAIGIGLASTGSTILVAVFTSIASGTFLYVGANEIVSEEFESNDRRPAKFFCMILGIGLISALRLLHND